MKPRTLIATLLAAAAVAVAAIVSSGDPESQGHVTLVLPDAASMFPGVPVRLAGHRVGEIETAEPTKDGHARLTLAIDNAAAWPLERDTRFRLRFGGTISTSNRYIEIVRGHAAADLADGATIAGHAVDIPLEVDRLAGTFSAPVRRDLKTSLARGSRALTAAAPVLPPALDKAPAAIAEVRDVVRSLGADPEALDTLVRAGDQVTAQIEVSDPTIGSLIENSATAFGAVARESNALKATLTTTPPLLRTTRTTLAQADTTLATARTLTARLGPGVREVHRLAAPLTRALQTISATAPAARTALATLRHAVPDVSPLLHDVQQLAPGVEKATQEIARQFQCVRPYAPELAGFFSTWASFTALGDKKDKFARVNPESFPFTSGTPLTPGQVQRLFPSTMANYAFPRPPGMNAGQPWFMPECGVGPEVVDPTKDPEATTFDPLSKNLISIAPPANGSGR